MKVYNQTSSRYVSALYHHNVLLYERLNKGKPAYISNRLLLLHKVKEDGFGGVAIAFISDIAFDEVKYDTNQGVIIGESYNLQSNMAVASA